MKMILASFLLSSLAALTTLQAQTIQQLNQPKDAPADVQTQLDLQKQYLLYYYEFFVKSPALLKIFIDRL